MAIYFGSATVLLVILFLVKQADAKRIAAAHANDPVPMVCSGPLDAGAQSEEWDCFPDGKRVRWIVRYVYTNDPSNY